MKRINLLNAIAVVGAISLTSCGGKKRQQANVDTSMAQLQISTFDGGVGDEWLKKAADLFMQKNKDRTDYENGKTGCQIWISRDRYGGDFLLDSDLEKDIYFTLLSFKAYFFINFKELSFEPSSTNKNSKSKLSIFSAVLVTA